MIPCLDFRRNGLKMEEEKKGEWWKMMSKKVREALENHGCFVMMCDEIPKELSEEMFKGIKALFGLPQETKEKHKVSKPYRSYQANCPIIPLCESFGIDDAPLPPVAQAFTNLMWPQGNPTFSETLKSMSSKLVEMNLVMMKMIMEGYDLPEEYIWDIEGMKSSSNTRLIKYKVPEGKGDSDIALVAHTDKNALTILCENEVHGLQVVSKSGNCWIDLEIPKYGFVVIVGDILKAWSNGRLHAPVHRVVMRKGNKDRYSFGVFVMPNDDMNIQVPPHLVDGQIHPLRYRPFKYGDYFNFFLNNLNENALEIYAAAI